MFLALGQDDLVTLLTGPGAALLLTLLILFAGWKKWWVFGWLYRDVKQEKDEWKEAALRGTRVAERVVSVAEGRKPDVPEP